MEAERDSGKTFAPGRRARIERGTTTMNTVIEPAAVAERARQNLALQFRVFDCGSLTPDSSIFPP
ncbi:hypothetical protein FM076_00070 [Streptomyces albus subsp. chlorinus]|uniref:hypothetical protein n=1 Tax=Streptomyces albus TaxID=1888 RepID=UPI00156E7AA1|nr:hypothetical protein [Streptomyces albus]NSC19715.1 hypothetical protein [Streptomyces albus subsp. chlorinus]